MLSIYVRSLVRSIENEQMDSLFDSLTATAEREALARRSSECKHGPVFGVKCPACRPSVNHQQIVEDVLESELVLDFGSEQHRRLEDSIAGAVRTEGAAVAWMFRSHDGPVLVGGQILVHLLGSELLLPKQSN